MPQHTTRRRFLKTTTATGIGFWVAGGAQAQPSSSPNEKIHFASVGIGGKGGSDSKAAAAAGEMVAICDVDKGRLAQAHEKNFPEAKTFVDFREMLDSMGDKIDAVTVSTPDHTHAPAALMAMRLGKHCFCQKPLTHTIYEARRMGELARAKGVATQMGNQGTANDGVRKGAALVQSGALGTIREVYVWTNRPIWPQGYDRPAGEDPVPETLDWNLWLGSAPKRPYKAEWPEGHPAREKYRRKDVYHPFSWRGWWDFGTGALGDMACHTLNMPFMALDLRDPISVQAQTSGHNGDSYPQWSIIEFQFAAAKGRPALKLVWSDGGKKAPMELVDDLIKPDKNGNKNLSGSGCLLVGDKGRLYSPDSYGARYVLSPEVGKEPELKITKSPGHFREWVDAIRGGPAAVSNFPDYAGPLTETILLGNLAVWADGEKVEWDAGNLKSKNVRGLEKIVRPEYRKGYTL